MIITLVHKDYGLIFSKSQKFYSYVDQIYFT